MCATSNAEIHKPNSSITQSFLWKKKTACQHTVNVNLEEQALAPFTSKTTPSIPCLGFRKKVYRNRPTSHGRCLSSPSAPRPSAALFPSCLPALTTHTKHSDHPLRRTSKLVEAGKLSQTAYNPPFRLVCMLWQGSASSSVLHTWASKKHKSFGTVTL